MIPRARRGDPVILRPRGGRDAGYPDWIPEERGARPINTMMPEEMVTTMAQRRGGKPPASKPPKRGLIADSISVGTVTQVIVAQAPYDRKVTFRARTDQIAVNTSAAPAVGGGGGWIIDPGEKTEPFILPANVTLYGYARAAAELSRIIEG